ncbi:MAG TPA: pyridoxamine 5'-phosphate oxidase family protein [Candidatus Limnocylindria bacterium]|nr:pyridoxamine 5'-phosphate oxidase family protein [Candidatus Limnocylindria bacterium]
MTKTQWPESDTKRIAELLKDIDICMFVTRAGGSMRGRPMSNNGKVEYDGDSWFFSNRETAKIDEITADPRVALAYVATEKGAWISIEGTGEVVEDDARKRELWDDQLKMWFKDGPEDDNVVLIKVSADTIHAWADGEELLGDADRGLQVVETEDDR